jgi:hypothetical protein
VTKLDRLSIYDYHYYLDIYWWLGILSIMVMFIILGLPRPPDAHNLRLVPLEVDTELDKSEVFVRIKSLNEPFAQNGE